MSRRTLRGILIFIIFLTIPCYLIGIMVWLFERDGANIQPPQRPGVATLTATFTPIDPYQAMTDEALTATPTRPFTLATFTPSPAIPGGGFTVIAPTAFITAMPFASPSPPPTFFIPPTATQFIVPTNPPLPTATQFIVPTNPPLPTATQFIVPTSPPVIEATATPPILLPPTDTPTPS